MAQFPLVFADGASEGVAVDPRPSTDQLANADPALWTVAPGWQSIATDFFESSRGQRLLAFLRERLADGATVFPPEPLRALALTPPHTVRVVILGQDPYHGRGQAEGLAFSVPPGLRIPPSLRNIFKELHRDLAGHMPLLREAEGSLNAWATAGVLLLNTCLTVQEGCPASHQGQGWEVLTDALIAHVSQCGGVVFMLWGAHAHSKRDLIDQKRNLVLCANHPSPLSAMRAPMPFIGCGHFSQANQWLAQHPAFDGTGPIDW